MMTVSRIAKHSGVAPHVVRYYARIGLLTPARSPDNGYKLFSRDDVTRLAFIRRAQGLGFTLEEISHFLRLSQEGASPCHEVREILRERIEENRRKIVDLMALQRRMEQALRLWEDMPDRRSEDSNVCPLIDAAAFQDA